MKILGMETAVGPKPSGLTPRIFTEFNQVFLEIYGELEHKKVVEYQTQNYESKGILKHGDFTLGKVRNWLAYHQLLAVAKIKEPDKNDKTKMRTVYQLGPTKLGKQAYQEGAVIEVNAWKDGLKLGIGKMYPDYEVLWKMCLAKAEADGVAKSRRENWYGTFRDDVFIAKLAAMTNDNAKAEALKWVLGMIAESPRKGHRSIRSIKRYNAVAAEGEILLGQQQSLMDFVKKRKPQPEKPKPKPDPEPTLRVIPTESKEDSAYICITAHLSPYRDGQSRLKNEKDDAFVPYFTRYDSISFVGRLGSSSGSGGSWYNAKHIALSVRHFISGALSQGVKRKNIKVVWEKNAKILYEQVKNKKIIPKDYYGREVNVAFVEERMLKIADNDTTNLWRGLEDYDVNKYDRENTPDLLDYCIWTLEKAGKKRKEIISILEKSRQKGFTALFNSWMRDRDWHMKMAEDALKQVLECVTKAQKREMTRDQWQGDYGCGGPWWHYDWIEHLITHETDMQRWAQLISKQYEIPDRALEIIEQADNAVRSIGPNSLPADKKGLGVKALTTENPIVKVTNAVVTTLEVKNDGRTIDQKQRLPERRKKTHRVPNRTAEHLLCHRSTKRKVHQN